MSYHHIHNSPIGISFYQHYLQQHAIMTQYFQGLIENSSCCACHQTYDSSQCSCTDSVSSENSTSDTYSSEYELEEQESYEDEAESDCEYELNVDAIVAMRAAKEEIRKTSTSESESIVLIDSDKEEFEMVDIDNVSTSLTTRLSKAVDIGCNRNEEIKNHKILMKYLYGEKSATIAGLETAMAVNFERLCDTHQPSLWPVLPARL